MTWDDAPGGTGASLLESVFISSLPETTCNACGDKIARRAHRMMLRASWRDRAENLCPACWSAVTQWASRFALQQLELPGLD